MDYETQGLDVNSEQEIAGIGISNGTYSLYIPYLIKNDEEVTRILGPIRKIITDFLQTKKLVAHNINFDGAWYKRECGEHANWAMCTLGMFKQLSTEGWFLQSWSLKTAMTDILGWDEPNTAELYDWLKERKLKTGDMWQAPPEILGKYCALDTAATFHLYEYLESFRSKFKDLFTYHEKYYLNLVRLLIDQKMRGLRVNRLKLIKHRTKLLMELGEVQTKFENLPGVQEHLKVFNDWKHVEWFEKEPPKFNKDGKTVAKRWEYWKDKELAVRAVSHFKITSKQHLGWLFYENIYNYSIKNPVKNIARVHLDGGEFIDVRMTKSGRMPVDTKVLPFLGEAGRLVYEYNKINKELSYVNACLSVAPKGTLFPDFNANGTVTGRISGGLST